MRHAPKYFFISAAILSLALATSAETITGTVTRVNDGDTIAITDETNTVLKIRMTGIDAPEIKQTNGTEAQKALADLIMGKSVEIDTKTRDLYGRILGKVYIGETDVNLSQLENGWAWYYAQGKRYLTHPDRNAYADAAKQAKAAKIGLWADAYPVPPWEIRKKKKEPLPQ